METFLVGEAAPSSLAALSLLQDTQAVEPSQRMGDVGRAVFTALRQEQMRYIKRRNRSSTLQL